MIESDSDLCDRTDSTYCTCHTVHVILQEQLDSYWMYLLFATVLEGGASASFSFLRIAVIGVDFGISSKRVCDSIRYDMRTSRGLMCSI